MESAYRGHRVIVNAVLAAVAGAAAGSAGLFLAAEMFTTYSGRGNYALDHVVDILSIGSAVGALVGAALVVFVGNRRLGRVASRVALGMFAGILAGTLGSKAYVELAIPSGMSEASAKVDQIRAAEYRFTVFLATPIAAAIGGIVAYATGRRGYPVPSDPGETGQGILGQ